MRYKSEIVRAFYASCGLPDPEFEARFHPRRKWRFDLAWSPLKIAIEVQGGIFVRGAHSRGAQMKRDWEKYNEAQALGWRVLQCEPKDLCTIEMVELVKRCAGLSEKGKRL